MAYVKVGPWVNGGAPPISAANLDTIETQYELAVADIPAPITVRKTANQVVNNSIVLVNDLHLVHAIAANEEWVYRFVLYAAADAAADFKATFVVPALCTLRWGFTSPQITAGATAAPVTVIVSAGILFVDTTGVANFHEFVIDLWVLNGVNAGNVQFQFAQQAAHASNLTLAQGSHFVAQQIA